MILLISLLAINYKLVSFDKYDYNFIVASIFIISFSLIRVMFTADFTIILYVVEMILNLISAKILIKVEKYER